MTIQLKRPSRALRPAPNAGPARWRLPARTVQIRPIRPSDGAGLERFYEDPGAIVRALRLGTPRDVVAEDLEHRSGLLGVSGRTADMRELLELEGAGDPRARLAIDMFVRRAAAGIAAAATTLPGLDALAFTGGSARTPARSAGGSSSASCCSSSRDRAQVAL